MKLSKKKSLASRALNIGKSRVKFVDSRKEEIKEAITKQDIRDLEKDGAIQIKEVSGRTKVKKRKSRRGPGKIRKKLKTRKQDYVIMTRKLRAYTQEIFKRGEISREEKLEIRKRIRNRLFKSKAHLKQYIEGIKK